MGDQRMDYAEMTALARNLRELGGSLRNGNVSAREAWQIVEAAADRLSGHAIDEMLADAKREGE